MKLSLNTIRQRLKWEIVARTNNTFIYPYIYKSYWHSLLFPNNKANSEGDFYFTMQPNPDAGIGHQLANWIAGYWWSRQFGLKFAHIPFPAFGWDRFLGFGDDEAKVSDLLGEGYRIVQLPYFSESKVSDLDRTKSIIASYIGHKIIFICERDEGYTEQYGVMEDIQRKFYNAPARKDDKFIYSDMYYNIAIHVRRGDIAVGHENGNSNLLMRWQYNDYFVNVLNSVVDSRVAEKPIALYLFSQGDESDFEEFKSFPNLHFCLKMGAMDSFLHMVYADLLITSKSSFSYKPALLNKGIKICPKDFWHGYPDSKDWILADENGHISLK